MKTGKGHKQQTEKKKLVMTAQNGEIDQWKYFSALVIILVLSFIAYSPVLHNNLLNWDDNRYINDNPLIYSINLKKIFSQYVMGNYHPLTILTFAIEYHFFGLNPTGYHAVNLFLHLINIILVFYCLFYLSEKFIVALVASLLFGIHPLHVESVAWVAELKDLLYAFFFLASYIFYLKYLRSFKKKYFIFSLLLFLLSLLSKAMAASLPLLLILTDYFKGRKISTKTLFEKVPFILFALTLGVIAVFAQKSVGTIDVNHFPYFQRIIFACYGFMTYLYKLLLPLQLSAFYPYPLDKGGHIPVQLYIYVLLFLGLASYSFYSLRFSRKIFFGIGLFAISIILVLQLLPVGEAVMADRYCYIPSIGIFYLAGEVIILLWSKKFYSITIILLCGFTVFFSVKTYNRCGIWKDEFKLWNNVISQYQNIPFVYYNRGVAFRDEEKYSQALSDFSKAIELRPDYFNALYSRGIIYMNQRKNVNALNDFNKTIELKPDYAQAYYNRGNVFYNDKKYEEAITNYSKVILLKTDFGEAYYIRGVAEYYLGKINVSCQDLKQAVNLGYKPAAELLSQICK